MKKFRSRLLVFVAFTYLLFPLLYLFISALVFQIPVLQALRILLSPSYYILSAIVMFTGYSMLEMKRWSWYLLLLSNILITYSNALIASDAEGNNRALLIFALTALGILILTYRLSLELKVPYLLPRIRWWESNPRYKMAIPTQIFRNSGEILIGETQDFSRAGLFIKTRDSIDMDEEVAIRIEVFGQKIELQAVVVWCAHTSVTHPKGIGLKFLKTSKLNRKKLTEINYQLRKISAFYRSARYLLSEEDFEKHLNDMVSHQLSGAKIQNKLI